MSVFRVEVEAVLTREEFHDHWGIWKVKPRFGEEDKGRFLSVNDLY